MDSYEYEKKQIEEKYSKQFMRYFEDEAHYSIDEAFRIKEDVLDEKEEMELSELKLRYNKFKDDKET